LVFYGAFRELAEGRDERQWIAYAKACAYAKASAARGRRARQWWKGKGQKAKGRDAVGGLRENCYNPPAANRKPKA
jgi:hypothetical protein